MPWRGPEVEGEFPTLGYLIGDWIESNCIVPDGPLMGDPYRLTDEMWLHLLWAYRLDPDARPGDGADAFQFGGSMLVRAQKWGKDPFLAARSVAHAFGPVVFNGWDARGEPVGKPHPSPWIAVAASNDDQTDNTFLPIYVMLDRGPLASTRGLDVNRTIVRLPCGNPIEPLTTTAWGRLGGRFTFVSITESGILAGTGSRGGLTFARTLKRNVGGMNGMWASVTNSWDPTEGSDAQATYDANDPYVYVDARLARKRVDIDNDDELLGEIRYQYGDSLASRGGWVSEQRIARDCRNLAYGESEIRRFYLGEVTAGERQMVAPERWASLARDDEPLEPEEKVTLGFDGSRSRDATSLVACRIRDRRLFHLRTWMPADFEGHTVPRLQVDQAVRDAFEAYEVWYLYADPYRWQEYLDRWLGLFPKRVVEEPTNVERRMDAHIGRFLEGIQSDELTHDGHSQLTEHVLNAALAKGKRKPPREDNNGLVDEHYLAMTKKREGLLIDAAVAAVLADAACGRALEDGALTETPKLKPTFVVV